MRLKYIIISSVLMFEAGVAQNDSAAKAPSPESVTSPISAASSTPVTPPVSAPSPAAPADAPVAIMDYKSVYEAATVEEEVKMAAERFSLTPVQQDIWLTAATDRRRTEQKTREMLDSSKAGQYDRNGIYMGLRNSHNTFHETVFGYLTPAQKQAFEHDRLILQEKQRRIAKIPPPPPPAPADTVAAVDSAAINKEAGIRKEEAKKSKKKKKKQN